MCGFLCELGEMANISAMHENNLKKKKLFVKCNKGTTLFNV